jgi:hypothetical protein
MTQKYQCFVKQLYERIEQQVCETFFDRIFTFHNMFKIYFKNQEHMLPGAKIQYVAISHVALGFHTLWPRAVASTTWASQLEWTRRDVGSQPPWR